MPIINKYVFLGIIQGLTEFLPVSSSAHLVIFQKFLQVQKNPLLLDIVLHLGTLCALVVFLRKDLKSLFKINILFYICLVTALTAIVVFLGGSFFEGLFHSPEGLTFPLLATGIILLYTKKFTERNQSQKRSFSDLKITDAICLGLTQGFSVIPGLSRSGITISALLFRNVERETAFKFSFLASILAVFGAFLFKIKEFYCVDSFELRYMAFGFFTSFLSGLLALKILLVIIRKGRLYIFGYYCLALGLVLWFV